MPAESSTTRSSAGVETILKACTAGLAPAQLVFESLDLSLQARFVTFDGKGVLLEILAPVPNADGLLVGAACCASFKERDRAYFFLSSVLEVEAAQEAEVRPLRVLLRTPRNLACPERRKDLRIGIPPKSNLVAEVSRDSEAPRSVRPVDIGLSGMCFEQAPGGGELAVGAPIRVRLSDGSREAKVAGVVVRRSDKRYGVRFNPAENRADEESLRQMVQTIEQAFLQTLLKNN
jgi:hypothetical protein